MPAILGPCQLASDALYEQRQALSKKASDRCFVELDSYRNGEMPREESVQAVLRLTTFLVDALASVGDESEEASEQGSTLHDNIVTIDEGIAARRVKLAIEFEDLIRGLQIMREEVWHLLSSLGDRLDASAFFAIERRVNSIFDSYCLGLSSSYRKSQSEMMHEQERALEKWEEVVKSAAAIHLKIPCSADFVKIVRLQAEAIARRVAFSEDELYDIITAVGEACDNCIEHGVSDKGIDVQYSMSPSEFRVEVRDYGPGFDPTGMGESPPDLLLEDGRGLFLMKQLMDVVVIESKPGHGTHTVLTKLRRNNNHS